MPHPLISCSIVSVEVKVGCRKAGNECQFSELVQVYEGDLKGATAEVSPYARRVRRFPVLRLLGSEG
jgi:hypothetical protein